MDNKPGTKDEPWTKDKLEKDLENELGEAPDLKPDELTDGQTIKKLAQLSKLDYDRQRVSAAKELRVRPGVLDSQVSNMRKEINNHTNENEVVETVKPWDGPVSGDELLNEYRQLLNRHCILPDGADVALALWGLGSYCINSFRIFPKACLSSPEKRCGKTTTLEILDAMTSKAITASNVTPSVIFRLVESYQPTLLIDEGDTFINKSEELRGIINSGHTKSAAYVLRVEGEGSDRQPKRFSTWTPMVIAMIKTPPDTIVDRSIMITLRRKLPNETIQKVPIDLKDDYLELRQKSVRWAQDSAAALKKIAPAIPSIKSDRAKDNWSPLLAIADQAGGEWPRQAREAMRTIEESKQDDEAIGPQLLNDIKGIFENEKVEKLPSERLVSSLISMKDRPWCEWRKGSPMTPNSLAKLLKPYNINSKQIWDSGQNQRGYNLNQFQDAFSRYLPTPPPIQSARVLDPNEYGASSQIQNARQPKALALQKTLQPNKHGASSTLALQTSETEEKSANVPAETRANDACDTCDTLKPTLHGSTWEVEI